MADPARILIVDDEPFNIDVLEQNLEEEGYTVYTAASGEEALAKVAQESPDLVLLDWMMPGMDGLEVLTRLRADVSWRSLPVILLTARATVADKVAGLDAGADDYLAKPFDEAELLARIRAHLRLVRLECENLSLRQEVENQRRSFAGVVGQSKAMERVYGLLGKVLNSDVTVLLSGETGTGKEVLARVIHREGPRRDRPFIAVNCGAMAEQLLESELFGHRRGAFTGAVADRPGLFETADGGTLFLDEIGETTPGLQVRLLRAIQEGEIRRVGDDRDRRVNVRVVAASHRDLAADVASGRFRQDLYYRLSVFPIALPPLRERREDIPELALHFLGQRAARQAECPKAFAPRAMDALGRYDWPGNIRELQNEVERAALLAAGEGRVEPEHLSERIAQRNQAPAPPRTGTLRDVVAEVERDLILRALERHGNNRTHAAAELGVSRWGLVQKMKVLGIEG